MAANGTAEIQQVGKPSRTYSMKGKDIASRKGKTRPPLNFLSILHNAKKTIDTSCPDKLCKQLYTGKYFVDENTNKNCFMLFARKLDICWIDNPKYWKWIEEETSGEEIEVAELIEVCWFDIRGKFDRTIDLSPGAMYEIVFVVRMIDDDVYQTHISNCTVTLVMILPRSRTQRNESLEGKPVEEWFEILVGEFIMSPENVGSVEFSMEDHGPDWKGGLIVKVVSFDTLMAYEVFEGVDGLGFEWKVEDEVGGEEKEESRWSTPAKFVRGYDSVPTPDKIFIGVGEGHPETWVVDLDQSDRFRMLKKMRFKLVGGKDKEYVCHGIEVVDRFFPVDVWMNYKDTLLGNVGSIQKGVIYLVATTVSGKECKITLRSQMYFKTV
ncbi:hypothetical protein TEA_011720 [Camellia sinensis var. sinensis]|uniref:Uncharacterized protein n=1 Tax=Camellia sinensis var. sinensis TaxID=542762 RepID=A0A4S4CWV5_CAMSN|nr:hypothetical protein TEA_011720 [Camellia sinensis var. sinensis]